MSIYLKFSNYLFIAFALLLSANSYSAKNDDYLKQIESEAIDDVLVDDTEPAGFDASISDGPVLDAPSTDVELIQDKQELIVDQPSFEKALEEAYPESYALYQQLTVDQKESVFKDFTRKKRLYNSTVKIISIYIGSH